MVSEKYRNYYRNHSHATEDEKKVPINMWYAAVLIASQSFLLGYSVVSFNPCLVVGDNGKGSECYTGIDTTCPPGSVYNDINLSTIEASLGNALTVAGSWIGTMIENYPCERYGRRPTMMLTSLFFVAGAAISCSAPSVYTLLVGRALTGIGVGMTSGVPVVLLAEIATNATRGTITSMHQIMLTWGIFVAGILSYGLIIYVDHGWRYLQAFAAIPALAVLVLHRVVPESPKWLLSNHVSLLKDSAAASAATAASTLVSSSPASECSQSPSPSAKEVVDAVENQDAEQRTPFYHQACEVLNTLRNPEHDIQEEVDDMLESIRDEAKVAEVSWAEVFSHREGFIIGGGLLFFQAMSGINSIISFSTTIFLLAGFKQSVIGTMLIGAVRIVIAYVEFELIDMMGRKTLLLIGTYAMCLSLVALAIVLLSDASDTVQGAIAAAAVLIYMCGFALGLGSVVWTVISEVLPTRVRMKSLGGFLSMNWFIALVISFLTLTAIDGLGGVRTSMTDHQEADAKKRGVAILYLIFAGWNFACLLFLHFVLPETKGWNPEKHDHILMAEQSTGSGKPPCTTVTEDLEHDSALELVPMVGDDSDRL